MATQLQIRRGTTAQMNAFTGAEGELAVNTSTDTVHVHDGATAGGFALAKADGSNIGTYAGSFTTISASGAITGNVTGNLTGSVLTAAQTNITSVGTLSALAVSGASTLTGAVGINIAPTSYKLTVNSGATTETTAAAIGYNGDAGTNLYINTDHGNNLVSLYASGSASKTMRFLSGSLEVMRLATTGDVGINNSNPSAFNSLGGKTLAVGNGTTTSTLTLFSDDTADGNGYGHVAFADSDTSSSTAQYAGLLQYFHGDNSMRFYTASTERLRIFSDGDVSIGMTANYAKLNVNGDVRAENSKFLAGRENAANPAFAFHDDTDTGMFNVASNILAFSTAGSERMRIDSSGNLLVNKTGAADNTVGAYILADGAISCARTHSANNFSSYILYSTGASAYRFYVGMGGTISAVNTTINGISDVRYKENIRDLDDGLAKVMQLQPRKFDWKAGKGADIKDDRGFIAQEFEEVFPDLISEWQDPAPEGEEPYKAVRADLIPTLVKAIQEQQATIEALTQRIQTLENN